MQEKLARLPTLDDCVHCGLCLGACPTYFETGREVQSPRGRIAAFRNLAEGKRLTPGVARGLDDCLVCRSCETACPSGISMEAMMGAYRGLVRESQPRLVDRLERWALRELFPYDDRLRPLTPLLRWFRPLFRALSIEVPSKHRLRRPRPYTFEQPRRSRGLVSLFRGCIANQWFREETQAAIRVLNRNGWRVQVPEAACCGALHRHAGLGREAADLGRRVAEVLLDGDPDFIVSDTAGCAAALREPLGRGRAIDAQLKTVDTLSLLWHEGFLPPRHRVAGRWIVAVPCHQRHGTHTEGATRGLLELALEDGYHELSGPDHCCGAAGLYQARRPGLSRRIGARALERFVAGQGSGVITGNAGCLLRWETLLGKNGQAVHPVTVVDRAYRGE